MDDEAAVAAWLTAHDQTFDRLRDAVTELARAAGHAGEEAGRAEESVSPAVLDAVAAARERALHLVAECRAAQALPEIPDPAAQTAFAAGVSLCMDAATAVEEAAGRDDVPGLVRAARSLDAGTEQFRRAAATLRQAGT